jgi:extradiol dioxygenase family protein
MNNIRPFHLAVPVHDLGLARKFYGEIMGCSEGRSSDHWIDYDLYGHQFVAHLNEETKPDLHENAVDGHQVPVPHFGVVLDWEDWEELARRFEAHNLQFIIEPYIRFTGLPGEQGTFFLKDFSGNALEFKSFKDINQLFAK